jgi:hypothetical protein
MTKSLIIFRKDVRHLWPHIAAFLTLMALAAILDPTYTGHSQSSAYGLISGFALPLACWSLIIGAIQEEKLIGDRQYWLTRPFSWKQLLGAKAIFVVALINLPLFAWHVAAYAAVGIPFWQHLPALLWRQFFFTAFYILPAAMLASITKGLGQIILTTLLIVLPALFLETFVFARYRLALLNIEGILITAIAVTVIAGVAAILVLQYSRRNTRLSRTVAVAVLVIVVGIALSAAKFSGSERAQTVDPSIRVSLDLTRGRLSPTRTWGQSQIVTLDLPIRIEGLRYDVNYVQDQFTASIEGGGNRNWRPRGKLDGSIHDVLSGAAWITIYVDRATFDSLTATPANIRGVIGFVRFGDSQLFPLPRGHRVVVPKVGVCTDGRDENGSVSLICYTPDPRASVVIGTSQNRMNWIIPQGFVNTSIPTSSDMQPLTKFTSLLSYRNWDEIGTTQMMTTQPLPPVKVDFDFPAVDLRRYIVDTR